MITIYYIQNKINGKMYIGQTTMSLDKRWYFHKSDLSHCVIMKNAIKKYGANNFEINAFKYCETQEEADQEEIYWIEQVKPQYNIRAGGSCGKHSEQTCQKISKSLIGNKRAAGMKPNQTSFQIGRPSPRKDHKGGTSWNKGKSMSEASKLKLSKSKTGQTKFTSEQINEMKQMQQNGLSNRAIGRHFNCTHATIGRLING